MPIPWPEIADSVMQAHDLAPVLHFLSKLYLEFMKPWQFFPPLFCFRSG